MRPRKLTGNPADFGYYVQVTPTARRAMMRHSCRIAVAATTALTLWLGGQGALAQKSGGIRAALLTDRLLDVIMSELKGEPRTPDNVWCVLDAVACLVAGLTKEPEALHYYRRALDNYRRDFAARSS
jgi:hypothetical protein